MSRPATRSSNSGKVADARKKTLLLSHGSMMNKAMFQPQIDGLANLCRVIAYDNLTWKKQNVNITLDDLVEDCREQFDQLGLKTCIL